MLERCFFIYQENFLRLVHMRDFPVFDKQPDLPVSHRRQDLRDQQKSVLQRHFHTSQKMIMMSDPTRIAAPITAASIIAIPHRSDDPGQHPDRHDAEPEHNRRQKKPEAKRRHKLQYLDHTSPLFNIRNSYCGYSDLT